MFLHRFLYRYAYFGSKRIPWVLLNKSPLKLGRLETFHKNIFSYVQSEYLQNFQTNNFEEFLMTFVMNFGNISERFLINFAKEFVLTFLGIIYEAMLRWISSSTSSEISHYKILQNSIMLVHRIAFSCEKTLKSHSFHTNNCILLPRPNHEIYGSLKLR